MTQVLSKPHASAIEFHGLAIQVIGETTVPGPETQVHEQVPTNGLYYRESGRLLTPQQMGNFYARVRAACRQGKWFELQRIGSVSRQAPNVGTARRLNPVFALDPQTASAYVGMRWIDEEGLHQATPQDRDHLPFSVTVQSWLGDIATEGALAIDVAKPCDRKIKSAAEADPALELYYAAMHAYAAVKL